MHYVSPQSGKPCWHFVGECGYSARRDQLADLEEYVFFLNLGVRFLEQIFVLPPNCELKVIWAQAPHSEGQFPIIAIGYDHPQDDEWMWDYANHLEKALRQLDKAVDWRAISCNEILRTLAED